MDDIELINHLGGPTELAKRLGYTKPGSIQRISNWKRRGIPAQVKVEFPNLFMKQSKRKAA